MVKSKAKRARNKEDMAGLNRTALIIGGATAVAILLVMIASFVMY